MKEQGVSVIIPHYELHDLLKCVCLPNLYLFNGIEETIVVDNGSKESLELNGSQKVIRSKKRLSFAAACNLGAGEATGDIFIFLNNDCQVLPGWLQPILESFQDKKVAICGAKLLSTDGKLQHIGIAFSKKRIPYHPQIGQEDSAKLKGTKDTLAVTGALMAIRASWFKEAEGFCEDFLDGNYEDVDICLRAREAGYKVKVALDSKVIHLGGASYGVHPEEHTDLLVRRNWEILNDKWKGEKDSFLGINSKSLVLDREKAWGL